MNKWRIIPKVRFANYKKEFKNMSSCCFNSWFYISKYWGGRIIEIGCKHYVVVFDFRKNWVLDMIGE